MNFHCNKHGIRYRSIDSAALNITYRLTASGCLDWFITHMSPSLGCSHTCFRMVTTEESEKVGLKLNIQKTKIMASGPITSWEIDGETVEAVSDFILEGSKITEDGDCSHEIKRHLLLGRKVMINLYSILKSKDITLPTKVCLVKAMVFPVVMYGCDSWTVNKAKC